MDKIKEEIIKLLQNDCDLPEQYQNYLFPAKHAEYELTYKGKVSRQKILSLAEEPQSIPFQKIKQFGDSNGNWENMLIFGDNFQVLKTLFEDKDEMIKNKVKGKVKLIYIDPPFATQDEFLNKNGAKAYSDKVKGSEFIEFIRERLILAREILSDDGSIFVHLDWKMSHYIKIILDEIFGKNNFRNEIIWAYTGPGSPKMKQFNRKHDTILWYTKTQEWTFNADDIRVESNVHVGGFNNEMNKEESQKYTEQGKIPEDWWKIAVAARRKVDGAERAGYPTEKPQQLLERIIKATTNPGDIVMDFFAGSGTTGYVAEKLNRKWIMCDIGKLSIYTIQKRFLSNKKGYRPFTLINAGCYDLRTIFDLDKQKYINFVRDLFHIDLEPKTINGILLDGKRRGDWVKIFNFKEFEDNTTAINEEYINDLHNNIGKKIGKKFYIVAPEMNIDIIGDYLQIDDVKYYLLRIPYQAIKELHTKDFKKAEQPKNINGINTIENSVGFYFNETPEVNREIVHKGNKLNIKINSVKPQYESINEASDILAMVLLDTTGNEDFVMQEFFFADDIKTEIEGKYLISLDFKKVKSNIISIIYIDVFGNEFKERIFI